VHEDDYSSLLVFRRCSRPLDTIGVGDGGAGDVSAPSKVLICQKCGQNLKTCGKKSLDIF